MFRRDFRRFLIFALWLAGVAAGFAAQADDYPVLRSNRLAYAIGRAEWDAPRNALYVTDQTSNRLVRVDLATGEETGEVRFTRTPESVKLSPDGSTLYVATLAGRRGSPQSYNLQSGYLHTINVATLVQTQEMALEMDPVRIAPRDDGIVAVAGGYPGLTRLDTYNIRTGLLEGTAPSNFPYIAPEGLVLHADGNRVYLGEQDYVFRSDGGSSQGYFTNYIQRGSAFGTLYIFPGGDRALNRRMSAYRLSTNVLEGLAPDGVLEGLDPGDPAEFEELAFDTNNNVFFTSWRDTITRWNPANLTKAGVGTTEGFIRSLYTTGDHVFALETVWDGVTGHALFQYPNPAKGNATNRPPMAVFAVTPTTPTTADMVRFDAGTSIDDGAGGGLRFQWDWDGDGVYDTAWSNAPVALHKFEQPGAHTVRLRIADGFGVTDTAERVLAVSFRTDAGTPLTNAAPFNLPFKALSVVFDPVRPVAYALDRAGRRVVSMDMNTGRAIRSYSLDRDPVTMTVTPDGRWLYVAQHVPGSEFPGDWRSRGLVSEFDLAAALKTGAFQIAIEPGPMVATDSRQIIIVTGSSGSETAMVYDASNGNRLWSFDCRSWANVVLAPRQDSFCVFEGYNARRYAMAPAANGTGVVLGAGSPNDNPPYVILPDGERVLGYWGNALDLTRTDFARIPGQSLEAAGHRIAVLDATDRPALFTIGPAFTPTLRLFNTRTLNLVRTIPLPVWPTVLERSGNRLFYAQYEGPWTTNTLFGEFKNPALGMETNRPPAISVRVGPDRLLVRRPVMFDVGPSTDDQDGDGELLFRWDLDGDGFFETGWTNRTTVSWTYLTAGNHVVRAEARDRWGEIDRWERTIPLDDWIDTGEAPAFSQEWLLPFPAADVAFDPVRPNLWATDRDGRAVVRVNLTNGLAEKRWSFPLPPDSLTSTPDGRFLYATLVSPLRATTLVTNSYVAEFDLQEDVLRRVIGINGDPTDIAADNGGRLFTVSRRIIQSHRATDGELVSELQPPGFEAYRLKVSQDRRRLYAVTGWGYYDNVMMRIDYGDNGIFGAIEQSSRTPGPGDYSRRVSLLPGETRLLDGAGIVYTNRPGHPDDFRTGDSIGIVMDCVELPGTGELLVAGDYMSGYHRTDTLTTAGRFRTGRSMQYAGAYTNRHFLAGVSDGRTSISPRVRPSPNPANNLPPQVRWWGPAPGQAFAEGEWARLEVDADDPDGGIEEVNFYRSGNRTWISSSPPFAVQAPGLPLGTNFIVAMATDNRGRVGNPVTNTVIVTKRPTVAWISPQIPAVLDRGENFILEVAATDPDGSVRRVDFYQKSGADVLVGSATNSPWRLTVTNLTRTSPFVAVAVDNHGVTGSSPERWVQLAGATGDDYYRPFVLQGESATFRASNTNASGQLFEPAIYWSPSPHSLWWTWTAPSSGVYRVNTFGSDFNTYLAVYADSPDIASLVVIGHNNDDPGRAPASSVKFTAIRGATYRFVVDGLGDFVGHVGNVVLSLDLESRSPEARPNDVFQQRIVMNGRSWETDTSNLFASAEAGEPVHARVIAGPSLWWEWTAQADGFADITTAGSEIDTVLAVYTGAAPAAINVLQPVAGNDDDPVAGGISSRVRFMVRQGVVYFIAVTGYEGMTGELRLALNLVPPPDSPPANDEYTNAIALRDSTGWTDGHNYGATSEADEPLSSRAGATVWYRWSATLDVDFYFTVVNTGTNYVYPVVFEDALDYRYRSVYISQTGTGVHAFRAYAGTTYSIALDTEQNTRAAFTFLWSVRQPVSPPVAALSLRPDGFPEIGYEGHEPATAIIMASPDLKTWEPVATNVFTPGQRFTLPPPEGTEEFYRLVFP